MGTPLIRAVGCGPKAVSVNNPPSGPLKRVTHCCYDLLESMRKCFASLPLMGRVFASVQVVVVQKPSIAHSVALNAIHASTQFVSTHKKTVIAATLVGVGALDYLMGLGLQAVAKKSLDSVSEFYYGKPVLEPVSLLDQLAPFKFPIALGSLALAYGIKWVHRNSEQSAREGILVAPSFAETAPIGSDRRVIREEELADEVARELAHAKLWFSQLPKSKKNGVIEAVLNRPDVHISVHATKDDGYWINRKFQQAAIQHNWTGAVLTDEARARLNIDQDEPLSALIESGRLGKVESIDVKLQIKADSKYALYDPRGLLGGKSLELDDFLEFFQEVLIVKAYSSRGLASIH